MLRRYIRWAVALILAGLAAWLSVRQVRWPALLEVLRGARPALLGLALVTILATTAAKAGRWATLLRACRPRSSSVRLLRVLLIGQLANGFLPRLGDVVRAVLLGPQAGGGAPAVFGTILVEKALDGVLGLAVLLGLGLWMPLPAWLRRPLLGLSILTAGLLLLLFLAGRWRAWQVLTRRFPASLGPRLEHLVDALALGMGLLRRPADAVLAFGLSALVWGLSALTNVVVLQALDIQAPGWAAWLVVATGYAATFLPTVPAQVGVFEYAAVLSLEASGVAPEPALAFALILHLLVQAPPAILGPLSMLAEGLGWGRLRAARREYLEPNNAPY